MQNAHSDILSTFIELPFVSKTFLLFSFEWPLMTGFYYSEIQFRNLVKNKGVLVAAGSFKEQKKPFQKTKASCYQSGI